MRYFVIARFLVLVAYAATATGQSPDDQELEAMRLLREYCKACHALGNNNFLPYESEEDNWQHITQSRSPHYPTWRQAIVAVLNWPTEEPPRSEMAPGRDFMPKGSRRQAIAADRVADGRSVRQFILDTLSP